MFFYSQGTAFNVVVSLSALETGVLLLGQAAAPLNPEYPRWQEWSGGLARAMETGGKIHVTVETELGRQALNGWRGPLAEAPERCRKDVSAALDFFARRHDIAYDPAKVEVIGLDGPKVES